MARQKRSKVEDAHNTDRWMVSYADFVTLLFAFFVVMYSISSINEGKYKTLSTSLSDAFMSNERDAVPVKIFEQPPTIAEPLPLESEPYAEVEQRRELSEAVLQEREKLNNASKQFEDVLSPMIKENLVSVKKHDFWVELQMSSELLFTSGSDQLSKRAADVLKTISLVLAPLPNAISVEGYTDNVPIETVIFRSNWDLSSARATSVVHELIKAGIDPLRLSATGYGEYHPVADNSDEKGRFQNRRVTLVITSLAFSRYGASDEERAKLLNLQSSSTPIKKP
ncbi:MAG: flagellar motor protein MotD [Methylococcales bacterium]|nr:flagellar motor protein MotD [Methylococcales bacterium]